jgi:hypothetical protein
LHAQSQRDINATMRGILIDWLVEVAEEYRLESETLFLAVNYIDRFLSQVPVNRSKLQLVGVTCMLVAAKYEEIHPPAVDEFVYISDNTYKVRAPPPQPLVGLARRPPSPEAGEPHGHASVRLTETGVRDACDGSARRS